MECGNVWCDARGAKPFFTPNMRFTLDFIGFYGDFHWLPRRDSNPNKQNQNLPTMPYLQGFDENLVANGGLPLPI